MPSLGCGLGANQQKTSVKVTVSLSFYFFVSHSHSIFFASFLLTEFSQVIAIYILVTLEVVRVWCNQLWGGDFSRHLQDALGAEMKSLI